MGRRGRSSRRIALRQKLPIRRTKITIPERKRYNMSRGRGGARRVLRGRARMSVSNQISRKPMVLNKTLCEDVLHCKSISEIQKINPRIQSELEKVMEIFSEEEEESKIFPKEAIQNGNLDSKGNEEAVAEVSKIKNRVENVIDCSEAKQKHQLPEKSSIKEDEDSDKKVPELSVKSLSDQSQKVEENSEPRNISKEKESIGLRGRSMECKVRNGKVRGIRHNGMVSIGQQRGHKYLNMLSKRNRLSMYKMSMDKNPALQRLTRSFGASPSVNLNTNPPDTKSRRKRKEFQPKPKRTLSEAACTNNIANNTHFDSSRPGTSTGCNQSSSSNDMSSLPTILRNSVIERNSDSELDEEEDIECAKRKSAAASKEVVDVIDGIAFVTFESEHDMVRFTRSATEESPSKSDGSDRRLILESLGAIIPRKTKDIKKIKGWQKKKFSVSLNPMSEPINHDGSLETHDDDAGNIVFEHNYIRRLSGDLESDSVLKSGDSEGDQKIDPSKIEGRSIPETSEEQSKSTSDSVEKLSQSISVSSEEQGKSTPNSVEERSKSTPCSSKEQSKSTPDTSKTGDWKQSAMSAFVSYHPEGQAKGVQSPSKNLPKNVLLEKNPRENPNEEKNNSKSQKISSVNGAVKMGKRIKQIKCRRDVSVQVDMPEIECKRASISIGDTVKYPSHDWLTTYNNWDIDHERAVFATSALVLDFPVNKKKKCITVETEQKEGGYSLRKRVGAVNRRRTLRSAKNGAPVRMTRALSNMLSPANQSPLHVSSELETSKLSSSLSIKVSIPDSKKSIMDVQNKSPKIRPSPGINTAFVSHSSGKPSSMNSLDSSSVDTPDVISSTSPVNRNEDSSEKLEILSPENVSERKSSSSPLLQITSDHSNEAISHATSENEQEENIKDSIENKEAKDTKQSKADESKSNNEMRSKSCKVKRSGSENDLETVEWEISHKRNVPMKEMSPDQDHEDIRVFLRPKPRFQGNQSMSSVSDASTFSSRTPESSFAFANNISPQKSGDMEVIKSRSPKSPALARKKLIRELMKLNANFVSVDEKAVLQKKVCSEEFCKLGCVCDSINTEKRVVEHCGRIECMFSCVCPTKSNVQKVQVIASDTVSRLQEESSRGMAKIEKDFHNTVVEADGELVLPGRRQRERRVPKRFLDDESINPDSLFSIKKSKHSKNNAESILNTQKNEQKVSVSDFRKKNDEVNMKQCKIPIENLPIPDLQVRCLNHFTVDCTCIDKFPRNIAVKSTSRRNTLILSKSPNRIPNFSLGRSKEDTDESVNNAQMKDLDLQEGIIYDRYINRAPSKALYIHHIQGDEVLSVKLKDVSENVREKLPNLSPKTQTTNSNVETVLLTSCARTVGIDLWSAGHPSIWKNKSLYNNPLMPPIEDSSRSGSQENLPKNDSENSSEANSVALEENAPMFKIIDVKSLPPGSFDPTLYTPEEGVEQPKHFSSYENFYSWIYSSHTMCQDLRSICSTSLALLPVNSVKLMKWKDLNSLIKNHSAHMWIRQRLGSKPRIYVTEKDIQPDAACVNFLDLEKREEELTNQVAIILKSAKEDLSSEHSCCILICRGCYWAVAGNINLEKHSANKKLQKEESLVRTVPRILIRKSSPAQTADVTNKKGSSTEGSLEEVESSVKTPVAERTLTKINSELTSSPKISAELTSTKAMCNSNQSEMLDPDQILSDIETSLPDILEGLVPCNNLGKTQDNLRCLSKEGSNSQKSNGNSLPSGLPISMSNIQFTASHTATSPKISLLKPRPNVNNSSSVPVKSVEVSITHLTSQDHTESSKFSSSLPTLTTPLEQMDGLGRAEEKTFSRIVGMSQTCLSSSVRTLMKPNIENLPPAALMEGDIDVCTNEDEMSKNKNPSENDETSLTENVVTSNKFIPLHKGFTVIGEGGKIIKTKNPERKELPLGTLSQKLSDSSKVKLKTDTPPVLIIDLKKLRKGPNAKNEPVKIPVRVTNLKTLAQGLSEPRNMIDNISSRIGKESSIVTNSSGPTLLQESGSKSKVLTPEKVVINSGSSVLKTLKVTKALTPNKSLRQTPSKSRKSSSPSANCEVGSGNKLHPSKISESQNKGMTVTSRNVIVHQATSEMERENDEKVIMASTADKSGGRKSEVLENYGKASVTSAVGTNVEKSRLSTPEKIESSVSPTSTDGAKTGLSSSSVSSELSDDKEKHLENDLIWYRLYLNHKFDRLVFTATSFSASEKRIISAVEMARSSNRTVRISFNKNANSYLEFRKGIYAVPTIEEKYVKIGPYAKDEPTGVLLLKKDGQSYKPVPNLLVKERADTSSSNETTSLSGESPCLGKEESSPNPSFTREEINEKGDLPSVDTTLEQKRFENFSFRDKSNLGSNDISLERAPCTDHNSAKNNDSCVEKVTDEKQSNNDVSMNNLEPEETDHVTSSGHTEESEQFNITSGIEVRSSKDDSGASQNSMIKAAENGSETSDNGDGAKKVNENLEGIPSYAQLSANNVDCIAIQTTSSPVVGNQEDGIIVETTRNLCISSEQKNDHDGVSDSEANGKKEKDGYVKNKNEVSANFSFQKCLETSEDSADLSIRIDCVEGNFSAYGDLPSCNAEEENAMLFENSCNELMADLRKSSECQSKEGKDAPLEDENYRYLSSEIIEQLRRKKLFGSLSIEPIFADNPPLPPVNNNNKTCDKELNKRKAVEQGKSAVAKKSTTGRVSGPLIPIKGYMFPDIPNLSPIPVKKGLMYSIENPEQPGQNIEVADVGTMNEIIDKALRMRIQFFPIDFRIHWTFVRAEKSSVPGMIDLKDITKDMFITSRGVFNYSDYKTLEDVKKLGLDKDEQFKYFEVKRRRDTELAKVEIASLFVPRSKAPELNLVKVLRKAIGEIKLQKKTEENLSQINLIETRKKLQLEDKYNALIRAEGTLTLYTPPSQTPPPQQPLPPPPPSPPPSPTPSILPVRRPSRGRPPKRRYFRGRWRGYRGGRGTAPSVSQIRGIALPSGSSMQPRNPVGRPRRGRPISRRIVTRGSLSLPASSEMSISPVVEPTAMPVVENVTPVVKNTMVKTNELTPTKRKSKNVAPPITSASPDTVRNLIATITAPKKVLDKKVPDVSDKTPVPEEEINSAKSAPQESSSDDTKKQDEEKANGQVNALLWKESFSKVKVATENPLPPTKDKLVDPKERMKKIIAESQEKWLQKLSCVPNSSKNLTSWSTNPPSPPSDSVC